MGRTGSFQPGVDRNYFYGRFVSRQTILQYFFLIGPHAKQSRTVLDSGFHAVDSRFQVLDSWFSYQWNLDSCLQSLVGFRIPLAEYRIPKPSIPDSAEKNFPDSRFHKPKIARLRNLDYFTYKGESVFALVLVSNKQLYSLVKPSSVRCCVSGYDDCFCVNTKAHCSVGHKSL